ncbi:MAG TPA: sulfatase-like hydrolase/transferase, partial [Pirellulaceae bacterium]|nr:sulfatase-like hydrolase/transferase [Pirellulaceae bacterium]
MKLRSLALSGLFACLAAAAAAAERPNIVLILADDLGYGDLHCFGAQDVQTPNLDRLAAEGLRLTSCYAGHPNCSPSRTALMTGRTPTRVGVRNWIPEDSTMHLRQSEITVARLLKQAGYATCHSGKWHLNGAFNKPTQPQPKDHGFDHWFSTQNNAAPSHKNPSNFVRNGQAAGPQEGYSAHVVVDEALRWLKSGRDAAKPFFLYVCFHEPHEPIAADEKYARLYPSDDPRFSAHHGNITQMDDAAGRLLRGLDEMKLRENTLVVFTSDNGPEATWPWQGSSGSWRGYYFTHMEGSLRAPFIIRWPNRIPAGRVSNEIVHEVDTYNTFARIAGAQVPKDRPIDGVDQTDFLLGKSDKSNREG